MIVRAAAVALFLAAAAPAFADVRSGVAAWAKKDYAGAVAQWKGPAAAGDADAQFNLGQAYRLGQGVARDPAQAETLFRRAAQANHPKAIAALGLLLYQKGARAEAMPWLQKAAGQGDPRAQYIVATALFNGDDLGKDWPRAYALMSRAAAAGLQPAVLSLAQMETYLTPADKRSGITLAATLAKAETVPAATRRSVAARRPTGTAALAETKAPPLPAERARPSEPRTRSAIAATERPEPDPGKGWRIQLGAFGSEAAAKAHWQKLAGNNGPLASRSPAYLARGGMVRLQAGPFVDKAAATRACGAATKAGSGCFPIAP